MAGKWRRMRRIIRQMDQNWPRRISALSFILDRLAFI
jgi:hypothetical protein